MKGSRETMHINHISNVKKVGITCKFLAKSSRIVTRDVTNTWCTRCLYFQSDDACKTENRTSKIIFAWGV